MFKKPMSNPFEPTYNQKNGLLRKKKAEETDTNDGFFIHTIIKFAKNNG